MRVLAGSRPRATTCAGPVTLSADPSAAFADLDLTVSLLDSSGSVVAVAAADPASAMTSASVLPTPTPASPPPASPPSGSTTATPGRFAVSSTLIRGPRKVRAGSRPA